MKADECRYWQSRPSWECFELTAEVSIIGYRLKHGGAEPPPFDKQSARHTCSRNGHRQPQCAEVLRIDNGPELTSRPSLDWCMERKITMNHIQPGKPMQNGHGQSFNGRFRGGSLR
jgi:hypothetical protein